MRYVLLLLFACTLTALQAQKLSVYDLTTEHKTNPIGIDETNPRVSWKIKGDGKQIMQTAYQLRVATTPSFAKNSIVWESNKVNSDASILIPYQGLQLKSGTRYYWQVKVWDNK